MPHNCMPIQWPEVHLFAEVTSCIFISIRQEMKHAVLYVIVFQVIHQVCSITLQHNSQPFKSPEAMIVPHQIIRSWYTGHWWVGCYIWYSKEETRRGTSPPRPLLTVSNVTAHQSTASVPILYYSMWHYNCLCSLKGLCTKAVAKSEVQAHVD